MPHDPIGEDLLRHIAVHGPSAVLRELATEVLAGRLTLAGATRNAGYAEPLASTMDKAVREHHSRTPEQRAELAKQAAEIRTALLRHAEPEPLPTTPHHDDDDDQDWGRVLIPVHPT